MESNNDYIIVQTVKGFLGEPKSEHDALSKKQWQFNCPSPKCRHDVDKFNLEYNSEKHLFKCWKCDYRGFVYNLAQDYGSDTDFQRIQSILPPDKVESLRNKNVNRPKVDHHFVTCNLPEGYYPLGRNRNTPLYKLAWDYLVHERKVSPNLIDKYDIGYTETGPRKLRIIIPSKNALGRYNYYEARSYMKGPKVIPYIKPPGEEVHKNDIIFNEYFINWDLPIFLVEGPFDMLRLPNAIPVLGKEISELLIEELMKHNSTVIICFDPDAIEKTVETYNKLSSLGLNVFFVDLRSYNKDVSKIFEDHGKEELVKAVRNIKRLDLSMQISKNLKDE
jgi:hypothetical protein